MEKIQDVRLTEACAKLESSEPEKGLVACESLARAGSRYAMLILGRIFSTGEIKGIEKNSKNALYWLEKASANGALTANIHLHRIYLRGALGVPENHNKAFHYIRPFENINSPNLSQALGVFMVASAYERGLGIAKDIPKAIQLYKKAANSGHIPSKINWSLLQIMRGNLLAIVPLLSSVLCRQLLLLLKHEKQGRKDPRLSV